MFTKLLHCLCSLFSGLLALGTLWGTGFLFVWLPNKVPEYYTKPDPYKDGEIILNAGIGFPLSVTSLVLFVCCLVLAIGSILSIPEDD